MFAPNGKGVAASLDGVDGFSVTGRWAWGSGTQHCRWVLGGALCDDGTFRLCWFPQSAVTFHDTWYTSGMRGSGSLDYSVTGEFAPADRTIQPGVTRPVVRTPLSMFPNFTLLAAGVSAVGLGVARRALDELIDLAQGKKPQYSSKTLAQSGFTQVEVARAEAQAAVGAGVPARRTRTRRGRPRSAVARCPWRPARGSGSRRPMPRPRAPRWPTSRSRWPEAPRSTTRAVLGRCLRDAHVVTQHIQTAPKLNETIGKLLLGVDVDTSMF